MSPIPSLRKGNYNNTLGSTGSETLDLAKFPPSFRIARNYGTSRTNIRYRGNRSKFSQCQCGGRIPKLNLFHLFSYLLDAQTQRPRMLHAIRKGASVLKASLPKIKDVNVIDKYSRMVFPVSFLAFNAGYWIFYILE